ncbi:hypothetical protein [Dyadobacter luticola]|uniref:Uncharacterized protein n=1 Tax=Dyadobacter luticola TaxID=1979387 RepID=A0A5R9KYF1_9BACT|nr:hypothetical protein [Dyadobacter luticola]TLV01294.1 hypothetical protein FEN17_17805 [Dyadobacter luticola]
MFNVKALWWTLLSVWILGSTYWHVCKIQKLCDQLHNSTLFLTEVVPDSGPAPDLSLITTYQPTVRELWQYAIMFAGVIILGFFTGRSYEGRKTRELKYRLNRINHELKYYQTKS